MTTLKSAIISSFAISYLILFIVAYTRQYVLFGMIDAFLWTLIGCYLLWKQHKEQQNGSDIKRTISG